MAQWINRLRNKIFVNQVNFEIFKVGYRNIRLVVSFNQGTASLQPYQCITALPMHSSWFFRVKPIARLIFKVRNFPEAVQFPINPYY